MAGTPVDIVRRVLSDPADPAVVSELVAEDSAYVPLNCEDDDLKKIMPWAGTGRGRQALLKTFTDAAVTGRSRNSTSVTSSGRVRGSRSSGR